MGSPWDPTLPNSTRDMGVPGHSRDSPRPAERAATTVHGEAPVALGIS